MRAGHSPRQLDGRQPSDQRREFLYGLSGRHSLRDPHHVGGVDDLAADSNVPVLGQGVLMDHDLGVAPGMVLTGLRQ